MQRSKVRCGISSLICDCTPTDKYLSLTGNINQGTAYRSLNPDTMEPCDQETYFGTVAQILIWLQLKYKRDA